MKREIPLRSLQEKVRVDRSLPEGGNDRREVEEEKRLRRARRS